MWLAQKGVLETLNPHGLREDKTVNYTRLVISGIRRRGAAKNCNLLVVELVHDTIPHRGPEQAQIRTSRTNHIVVRSSSHCGEMGYAGIKIAVNFSVFTVAVSNDS